MSLCFVVLPSPYRFTLFPHLLRRLIFRPNNSTIKISLRINPKIRILPTISLGARILGRTSFFTAAILYARLSALPIDPHATFRRTLQIKMCLNAIIQQETRERSPRNWLISVYSLLEKNLFLQMLIIRSVTRSSDDGGGLATRVARVYYPASRNPVVFSVIYETASVWFSGSL